MTHIWEDTTHQLEDHPPKKRGRSTWVGSRKLLSNHLVDGSEIPNPSTVWMFVKPCKIKWGFQLYTFPSTWEV